jgi:hypothetical protein
MMMAPVYAAVGVADDNTQTAKAITHHAFATCVDG